LQDDFNELLAELAPKALRWAKARTGTADGGAAEDIANEALGKLIAQGKRPESPSSYLYTAVYSAFCDYLRKKISAVELDEDTLEGRAADSLDFANLRIDISRSLKRYSAVEQKAICLHLIEGYTLRDLAKLFPQYKKDKWASIIRRVKKTLSERLKVYL